MASEQTVEQTKKIHELIAVKLNIPELLKFDLNSNEEVYDMLKNCTKTEKNHVQKLFKALKEHFDTQYLQFNLKIQELEYESKIEKMTTTKAGKKEKKAKSSTEEGAEKKPSAVTKPQQFCEFTTTYMSSPKFKDSNPEIFKVSDEY